jgi:colanic acid/amylovoran biosynthesis glycosyltransferase
MRIAFLLSSFPVISETFILRQMTGLLDLGHQVDIYAERRPPADAPVHPEINEYGLGTRTIYLDKMPAASGYWEMPVWPISGDTWLPGAASPISNERRALDAVPTLLRCLQKVPSLTFKVLDPHEYAFQARSLSALYRLDTLAQLERSYDVLHAHFGPTGNTFRFARELWRAPLVVSFHGYDVSAVPRHQGPDVYRSLFQTADLVTANSSHMRDRLTELGCSVAKVRVLPYGLSVTQFPFGPRRREGGELIRVLTVARLVEKKGVDYSLRAFAEARRVVPHMRYDIAGDGPNRPALEELARSLDLGESVVFHGAVDGPGIARLMGTAHLFVLASVTPANGDQEGTPVALLEAQACGLPVLSTFHAGIPEIVQNEVTGLLVPERDVAALSGGLIRLATQPDFWPQMGRAGRKRIERDHDLPKVAGRLLEFYAEAIRRTRGSGKVIAARPVVETLTIEGE